MIYSLLLLPMQCYCTLKRIPPMKSHGQTTDHRLHTVQETSKPCRCNWAFWALILFQYDMPLLLFIYYSIIKWVSWNIKCSCIFFFYQNVKKIWWVYFWKVCTLSKMNSFGSFLKHVWSDDCTSYKMTIMYIRLTLRLCGCAQQNIWFSTCLILYCIWQRQLWGITV